MREPHPPGYLKYAPLVLNADPQPMKCRDCQRMIQNPTTRQKRCPECAAEYRRRYQKRYKEANELQNHNHQDAPQ